METGENQSKISMTLINFNDAFSFHSSQRFKIANFSCCTNLKLKLLLCIVPNCHSRSCPFAAFKFHTDYHEDSVLSSTTTFTLFFIHSHWMPYFIYCQVILLLSHYIHSHAKCWVCLPNFIFVSLCFHIHLQSCHWVCFQFIRSCATRWVFLCCRWVCLSYHSQSCHSLRFSYIFHS